MEGSPLSRQPAEKTQRVSVIEHDHEALDNTIFTSYTCYERLLGIRPRAYRLTCGNLDTLYQHVERLMHMTDLDTLYQHVERC
jgi:hypothetical protein